MAGLARRSPRATAASRLAPTRTDTEIGQTAQAFDEMLDELEGAETRARQAEERTRGFLADAAHELRTPITGVQAAAETLLHHGDQLTVAQRQQLETLLIREAQRAGAWSATCWPPPGWTPASSWTRAALARRLATRRSNGPGCCTRGHHDHGERTGRGGLRGLRQGRAAIIRNLVDNAMRAAGPSGGCTSTSAPRHGCAVLEICRTPGRACRRPIGSGSSSAWSGWTAVGPPTPADPASAWPSPAATPGPTAAT